MDRRAALLALALGGFLMTSGRSAAGEAPGQDLKPFLAEVRKLVEKHYPKARFTLKDRTISFSFNTRQFMIHEPHLTGEWQDAYERAGPQKGGIMGELELRDGGYGGQAVVPHAFDVRYFTTLLLAPYSKKLDQHIYVHFDYPSDVSKKFVEEFAELMKNFDQYVPAKANKRGPTQLKRQEGVFDEPMPMRE
ncbi:hypothetical protein [Zavarzinella formosa]|uniref:hypothetical protein n=1 Tax=Zavarzinella formosa TaxID=360055 RepID=UPI0003071272|nr:hypothetical protein [Zavarzinella formosa]